MTVKVRNSGDIAADEVVQVYLSVQDADFDVPNSTLAGFRRVQLAAGESQFVTFAITPEQRRVFDREGVSRLVAGRHTVRIGGVSPGKRAEELIGQPLLIATFRQHEAR